MSEELFVDSMNTVEMTVAEQDNVQMTEDSTTRIINAISPTAAAERVEHGVKITITDKNGTTTATAQDGDTGEAAYTYIKYSAVQPTQDSDMKDSPDEWMGIYTGGDASAPTTYESYTWYKIRGAQGDPGDPGDKGDPGEGVPTGGAEGQFLKKSSSVDYDTEWDSVPDPQTMTGATSSADGEGGLVPGPEAGDDTKFLRGDATWSAVPDPQTMTGATATTAGTGGLVPAPAAGANVYFLKGDGTWAVPAGGKLIVKDLDTVTNTSGSYTHTTTISDVSSDMKAVMIELGNPDAFLDTINVETADGSITLSCNSVAGTSTVKVSLLFIAGSDSITSSEFDVLAARIGTLSSLTTTAKTSAVAAINELDSDITALNSNITNLNNRFKVVDSGSIKNIKTAGIYYLTSNVTDKPINGGGVYVVGVYNDDTICGVFISEFTNEVYQIRNNANTITPYLLSIRTVQASGTTSSTGAIGVPSDMINYKFLNALLTTGSPGFVIRRDYNYFTVFNNDGTPMANTAVAFTAYFM